MLYRWCRAGGEGLFTCSFNELNRNLNFVKEEFGNRQSFGEGGGRVIYHERYLIQRFLKDYSNWLWFPYNSSLIVSFE